MNNHDIRNKKMGDNMFGDEEHQVVAREALPILIKKAKVGETINYSTLTDKLGISPYEYPMPKMLGSIVTTLAELGVKWQEDLPRLTALVVKRSTGYPSFPPGTPNEVFDREFKRIYNYPKWDAVQRTLLPDASDTDMEYELFSRRQKRLRGEVSDVYQYETIPRELRVQIFRIWEKVWGEVYRNDFGQTDGSQLAIESYRSIKDTLCEEYGVLDLDEGDDFEVEGDNSYWVVRGFFFDAKDTDKAIDVIEVSFRYIEAFRIFHKGKSKGKSDELGDTSRHKRRPAPGDEILPMIQPPTGLVSSPSISPDEAIDRLNRRLRQHSVGYQYASGQIIRVDSQFIHSEVIKPALGFLSNPRYEGANEEFLEAHKDYRNGDYKGCITNCLKAFESCLKTICQKRKWHYDDKNAPAKKLIQIVLDKKLIPSFMESHFRGLIGALESGLPTLRNRKAGHGQGPERVPVPDYIAAHALHLTASNILLLVKADENMENV